MRLASATVELSMLLLAMFNSGDMVFGGCKAEVGVEVEVYVHDM